MYDHLSDDKLIQNMRYMLDELDEKLDAYTANRLANLAHELMYRANLYQQIFEEE